ncbi:hypothetical protein RJ640_014385 [Escallonia rubra]|uniref:F-box domain-containing protein n=1 Tax=Escallonia rubra TaxID=112253 RepID=A0AA88QPN0_9ASTE|nr:hypothetical protein RJ640_014385 [Escallonia rubra]
MALAGANVLSTTSKLLSSDHHETKHPPLQRCRTNDGDDWLSNLPDEILCHILSFLPTKNAVATSILSSRYSSLWSCIPVLDFHYQPHLYSPQKFVEFVNKVLVGNRSPSINTLKLSFENSPFCANPEIIEFHDNTLLCGISSSNSLANLKYTTLLCGISSNNSLANLKSPF